MDKKALLAKAIDARRRSYSPYSGFSVGAALLCADGSVYLGCNVENASFGLTCCAERNALFSAIADGKRDFVSIAIAGGRGEGTQGGCTPCGACRQVLSEFCSDGFEIITEDSEGRAVSHTLGALLPERFGKTQLS